MGLRNWLGSTWRGTFVLRRLFTELRATRKALERIADSLDDHLYLQIKAQGGFSNYGIRTHEPETDESETGIEFMAQSDEEFGRLYDLEMAKGGPDAVALDADLDNEGDGFIKG